MEQWMAYLQEQEAQAKAMVENAVPANWEDFLLQNKLLIAAAMFAVAWFLLMPDWLKDWFRGK
ncbi:MAG TPA: hypothetical protein VHD55_01450 [Candidatus Paceibacterota bacterium]|nr:hypothetical protein [Candidatus Paceibacterota bacterium]